MQEVALLKIGSHGDGRNGVPECDLSKPKTQENSFCSCRLSLRAWGAKKLVAWVFIGIGFENQEY